MIFSGVFERYPKLQVGAVEHELSWIPHFLDRLDYTYTQRAPNDLWYRYKEDAVPSDYFHRNVFVGFQEDALGIRDRHIIGVDNLQWGSDYPHQESTFPPEPADPCRGPGGLYGGGEGQNRRRQRREDIQHLDLANASQHKTRRE